MTVLQSLSEVPAYRIAGRVRRCRGALAICEGLTDLVGLGEACWIEQTPYNSHGCSGARQPVLAEVLAIDEAGVHLLPFDDLDGIGVGARVIVARDQERVRPTPACSAASSTPSGDRSTVADPYRRDRPHTD